MTLNEPRVFQLAEELAGLTGKNLADAVIQALEAQVLSERAKRAVPDRRFLAADILEFAERFRVGLPSDCHSSDHAELYGPDGLPS